MLHTAPSISAVRVGKHEQITRLLIAARSEEVSTLRLPARLETLRQAPAWKERCLPCTFSYFMYKCVHALGSFISTVFFCFCARARLAARQTNSCHAKTWAHYSIVLCQSETAAVRILWSSCGGDTAVADNSASDSAAELLQRSLWDLLPRIILFQCAGDSVSGFIYIFFFLTTRGKKKKDALFLSLSSPKTCSTNPELCLLYVKCI